MIRRLVVWACCLALIACTSSSMLPPDEYRRIEQKLRESSQVKPQDTLLSFVAQDGCSGKVPEAMAVVPLALPRRDLLSPSSPSNERFPESRYQFNIHCMVVAAEYRQLDIIKWLIESPEIQATPNVFWTGFLKQPTTPLQNAIQNRDHELVDYLLQNGALPYVESLSDGTPYSALIHAARLGDLDLVKLLLVYGAEPNRYIGSETALIAALSAAHAGIAKLLIEHGAFPSYSDAHLPAPIDVARRNGLPEFADYLVSLGAIDPEHQRERVRAARAERTKSALRMAAKTIGTVAGVALIGAAGYYANQPANTATYYTPRKPLPQNRSAPAGASCDNDFECGVGYACIKAPLQTNGSCYRAEQGYGVPSTYTPQVESIGPNLNTQGQCPATPCAPGYRCEVAIGACVR